MNERHSGEAERAADDDIAVLKGGQRWINVKRDFEVHSLRNVVKLRRVSAQERASDLAFSPPPRHQATTDAEYGR
jgi:hypothetical protein